MANVRLTVEMDAALKRRVRVHAARTDTTVSALVRRWIQEGLASENLPPLATERPSAGPPPPPVPPPPKGSRRNG
jgi:plasmid stability protein